MRTFDQDEARVAVGFDEGRRSGLRIVEGGAGNPEEQTGRILNHMDAILLEGVVPLLQAGA
jgi:hypothetical protein